MSKPRAINIFLHDGDPEGIRTAQIMLSTIHVIAFKKMKFKEAKGFYAELARPGVYMLVGNDENNPDQMVAYIGESENVADRLETHIQQKQKTFWTDTLVAVSKDENLTKSHARYVEARLLADANQNPRWQLANKQEAKEDGKLPYPDRVVMNEFIDQTKTLAGALGYDLFRVVSGNFISPTPCDRNEPGSLDSPTFLLTGTDYSARMQRNSQGQYIVAKGSLAKLQTTASFPKTAAMERDGLLEKHLLIEKGKSLEFQRDLAFSSLSTAAAVVVGYSIAGPTAWKTAEGQVFRDWENAQLIGDLADASSGMAPVEESFSLIGE